MILNSVIHGFDTAAKGSIYIKVEEEGENIEIEYSDTGKGMSEEQLRQLFDPFFTTKREQGGSGLGTHIVYNLVRQTLGGNIEATSAIGQGLCYKITFPKENTFAAEFLNDDEDDTITPVSD
jgi:signal transduction histidine kinase